MVRALVLVTLILLPVAPVRAGDAQTGRIVLLSGEVLRGAKLVKISSDRITFRDAAGKSRQAKLDDFVSITNATGVVARPHPAPHDVVVLLRGGDRIHGALLPGSEENVGISSPLAGSLRFHVDALREMRFDLAWQEARERPVFDAEEQDIDIFVYQTLDRLKGTYLRIAARAVVAHTSVSDEQSIDFAKLLAIRFADAPAPEVPAGRLTEIRLTDGSRITARAIASDGKKLTATTLRGEKLEIALASLLSLHQKGGRFVYLSDLKPAKTTVVPWIGETYAWDRPRIDRSFLDRTIRVGEETYQKGIGVISGTSITFELDGTWRLFTSRIAVDDSAGEEGDVIFEVLVDGKSKYRSKVVKRLAKGKDPARIPPIDLGGAKEITLRVQYVDDFVMDFANWIEPMLVR